jgi:ribosome maturation factor RimP
MQEVGIETVQRYQDVAPIVERLGYSLVDLVVAKKGGRFQVRVVIYSPKGTGIKECSDVHRLLQARLEVSTNERDPYIEVTSPGIDRTFRNAREFGVFIGRGVKLYRSADDQWTGGIISRYENGTVFLTTKDGVLDVPIGDVQKAKLDYSQEG